MLEMFSKKEASSVVPSDKAAAQIFELKLTEEVFLPFGLYIEGQRVVGGGGGGREVEKGPGTPSISTRRYK